VGGRSGGGWGPVEPDRPPDTGGSVRDFLATPWIVFNVADVAVVAGLCAYLLVRMSTSAPALKEVKT
jgi:lipoprotein signal peptidase